jgi:hypothetical protein
MGYDLLVEIHPRSLYGRKRLTFSLNGLRLVTNGSFSHRMGYELVFDNIQDQLITANGLHSH